MKTPTLIYAQSEVNQHNIDTEALFGYFANVDKVPPANEDIEKLFDNRNSLRCNGTLNIVGCLNWIEIDYDPIPQPNKLSEYANLKRYFLGLLG